MCHFLGNISFKLFHWPNSRINTHLTRNKKRQKQTKSRFMCFIHFVKINILFWEMIFKSKYTFFRFFNQRSGKRTAEEVQPLLQDPRMLKIFYKAFEPYCYDEPKCNLNYPYRLTCGACNNLRYPLLGKAFTVYRRIVPSNYEDGIVKLFN